ncbi:hypothetical protein BD410DRAFT_403614 [Rickenella mellea]|uniref:DUF6535 domain-containing protein n=1 Tax=Rickenella mellea TaxID=50990 RepID=A0A4Y7PX73_9AGAM|nr:hypothetical protein BD410DRAFT_403614 [Rickenella mellea]
MQWWKMDVIVDMIPALLHISLILFFIGLLLFVRAVSYSLAVYILYFSAIGGATYSILTIIPLIFPACPYKTPFTGFFRLCMTGGTTLFRLVWRCTLVLLATLEVLLLQVISSAARLWLPSFSIQKRERALEISEPVRSAMSRCCNYLCEKRHTIINCNVGTTVTAMATFHPYFHRCLQFWLGRSEKFHNDLSIRDANALRWTMEYSKRDADLFTMVQSVPEFVQLYDSSPNVLDIMRKSGITSQTIRILRLSVGPGNEVTNQAAFVSCLESIISVMPCSTLTIRRSGYQLDDHAWLIHHLLDVSDRTFAMQSSLGSVFLCAISSLILHYTTAIEEEAWVPKVKEPPGHPFNFGFYPHIKWKLFHLCRSWSQYDGLKSLYSAVERIEDLIAYPRILISPSVFSKELQVFRSRWMTSWLTFYMTLSLPHNPLIWKTIRHGATHLQHFPHSTRDSQCAAFAMMDILLRSQPHSWEIAEELSVYSMVLYGGGILYLYRDQRQDLHADFLNRVRVYGSSTHQFMESGGTVVVTYEQYTKILHNHVSSHQQFENDDELEAHARTIKQFIRRRLKEEDADENVNVLLVDAQHLANARALLNSSRSPSTIGNSQIHWAWNDLIYRIARDCGYEPQLWGNYNVCESHIFKCQIFTPSRHRSRSMQNCSSMSRTW